MHVSCSSFPSSTAHASALSADALAALGSSTPRFACYSSTVHEFSHPTCLVVVRPLPETLNHLPPTTAIWCTFSPASAFQMVLFVPLDWAFLWLRASDPAYRSPGERYPCSYRAREMPWSITVLGHTSTPDNAWLTDAPT